MTQQSMPIMRGKQEWAGLAVLVILILGRLGFAALVFARPDLAIANDSDRYVPIANAILSGQALTPDPAKTGLLLNTVGYPLFLSGVYLILGHGPGDVALAQLMVSGILALIIYVALLRTVGFLPALISSILLLIDPLTILWSMTVLTETVLAVVLGAGAVAITSWASSGKTKTLVLAGVLCGLACLVKPYVAIIVGIWGVALVFYPPFVGGSRRAALFKGLRRGLLFVVPTIVLATPWVIRNAWIWNCPALSSVDRVTMRDYVAAKVLSEADHVPLDQVQSQLQASDPGVCPRRSADYLSIVLAHPAIYAKLHVAGTIPVLIGSNFDRWFQFLGIDYTLPDLWGPFVDGGVGKLLAVLWTQWTQFPQGMAVMLLLILFQLMIYGLVILGLLVLPHTQSASVRWNIVILSVAVLVLVLTPGQGGNERFRVPAQPLLVMLSAYGIAWKLLPFLDRRRQKALPAQTP